VHRFGAFELNLRTSEVHANGERVALTPQSLAVLTHLLLHRDRTVSREELLREVWRGVQVNEGALRQAVFELRQALNDTASEPSIIKTVRTKGYRFVAEVALPEKVGANPSVEPRPFAYAGALVHAHRGLYGREQELSRLRQALDAALQVSGRACLIVGEAGIGKSRLVRELLDQSQTTGLLCLEAHADQAGSAPLLWPFTQLLRAYLEAVSPAARVRCEALAAGALRALLVAHDAARPSESWPSALEQTRFGLFEQAVRLFVALSRERPALLVLEDLHWADAASLAFLGHLSRVLPQSRLLLVVTSRVPQRRSAMPEDRALARALEALGRGALDQRVALEPLGVDAVFDMLEAHAPGVPRGLAHQVHALTQGNPLFSLELARLSSALSEDGALLLARERPEVLSVIRARLSALPEALLEALAAAAVIGREFSLAELARLLEEDTAQTLARLDACVRAGVMVQRSELSFVLAHPLIERAVYDDLPRAERAALHHYHCQWLERSGQARTLAYLHELSHHSFHAAASGAAAVAVRYAIECAERAMEATGYESARLLYERALRCSELLPDAPARLGLSLELGRAEAMRAAGGDNTQLNALFLELSERAYALSEPQLVARAALGFTGQLPVRFVPTRLSVSADPREVALIERALAGLSDEPGELRALLLCALGYALGYTQDWWRCEELFRDALAAAEPLGKPWLMVRVLMLRINVCAAPGRLGERLRHADRLIELTQQHGLQELELEARLARMLLHLCRVDVAAAERDEERMAQLAEQLDTDAARGRALVPAIWRAFMRGEMDAVARLSQQAHTLSGDDVYQRNIALLRAASVAMLRSTDMIEPLRLYERMFDSTPAAIGLRTVLASANVTTGRFDAGIRHFDAVAEDDFRALPRGINWLTEMSFMADAANHLGDEQRSQRVYDALLPYADEFTFFGGEVCPGMPIAYWLAELSTTLGDYPRAYAWLERARAVCSALSADMLLQYMVMSRARIAFLATAASAHEAPRALVRSVVSYAESRDLHWLRRCALRVEADCAELRKRKQRPRSGALRIVSP
jgi:DNA-binding winged helix-turn-helix (wHTH) protein